MSTEKTQYKFSELREKSRDIFDEEYSHVIDREIEKFIGKLEGEIRTLPNTPECHCEIYAWVSILQDRISSTKKTGLSLNALSKLQARKNLKSELERIQSKLVSESLAEKKEKQQEDIGSSEKLTIKQQVLLLKATGILNMRAIKSMPDTKKARLFSHLLNRGEKGIKDCFTYLKKDNPDFFMYKDDNIEVVNALLKSVGIQEYIHDK